MTSLEQLLVVQAHDTTLDQLRHRRATLPEREVVTRAEAVIKGLAVPISEVRARHDEVARDVKRLEDEAGAAQAKAEEVDAAMYSGTVTSPKELQAMQADLEQIRRHQRALEDRELEFMEAQEAVDTALAALGTKVAAAEADIVAARAGIAAAEAMIDEEIATEVAARAEAASGISDPLMATYERCRAAAKGIGVARLVGQTCQGCRLTIPASEVDHMRHAADGDPVSHCDNCGAILVLTR